MNSTIGKLGKSAQTVISIDDLLQEILIRVPIKPLSRFQLVSKHWHSLISSPRFRCRVRRNPAVGLFLSPSNKNSVAKQHRYEYVPLCPKSNHGQNLNFTTQDPFFGIRIYHSCNGLLLCWNNCEARFYVYNPTTNRFSTLPTPDNVEDIEYMYLVFDPSRSHHYKILCVKVFSMESVLGQVEVYSSETPGPWVKCGGPFKALVCFPTGVYWNGAIHWFKFRWYMSLEMGDVTGDSLYFNPDDRHHRMVGPQMMPTPSIHDDLHWSSFDYYFGESCNHLHYIHLVWPQIQLIVYEMRTDYSEWFVKYRVEASQIIDACQINRDNLKPNDWWRYYDFSIYTIVRGDKEEEDSFLIFKFDGKVTRYNLVYGACETIYEFRGNQPSPRLFHDNGFQYIESMCHV